MNITIIHFLLLTTESVISKMFAESEVVARYEEVQGVKHVSHGSSGSHNSLRGMTPSICPALTAYSTRNLYHHSALGNPSKTT